MTVALAPASHGLWRDTAIMAPATQPLQRQMEVDIAVVGAGFTGLSTALHLAEAGRVSVAVLEAHEIGFGASGRNAGMVNAGAWIEPDELPKRLGAEYGGRLLRVLGDGPDLVYALIARYRIACDAHQNGNLHCAIGQKGLANITERARQWARHGVAVQLLDATQTARLVGTNAYAGSLLDPRTGTIQPLSYVRGLAQAAIGLGAQIFTQSPLIEAQRVGGQWHLSTANGGMLKARQVVVATNTQQIQGADAWPQLQADLLRMPYFNVATQPLPAHLRERLLPQGRGAWDTAAVLSSFRMDARGRLVYGSVGAIGRQGQTGKDAHVQWVRRSMRQLFPELHGVGIDYAWHGWIDATDNHLPRLHQLAPQVWALTGYNGRGIGPGTIFGRELARMMLGQIRPEELPLPISHAVKPIRFKAAKERFYLDASRLAHAVTRRV